MSTNVVHIDDPLLAANDNNRYQHHSGYGSASLMTGGIHPANPVDMNRYSSRKSLAHGLLNVTLFINNLSSIRHINNTMQTGQTPWSFSVTAYILLVLSLILQVVSGFITIFLTKTDLNKVTDPVKANKVDKVNTWLSAISFAITISNIIASSLVNIDFPLSQV